MNFFTLFPLPKPEDFPKPSAWGVDPPPLDTGTAGTALNALRLDNLSFQAIVIVVVGWKTIIEFPLTFAYTL